MILAVAAIINMFAATAFIIFDKDYTIATFHMVGACAFVLMDCASILRDINRKAKS